MITRLGFGAGCEQTDSNCSLMSNKGLLWPVPSPRTLSAQLPSVLLIPGLFEQGKLLKIPSSSWLPLLVCTVNGSWRIDSILVLLSQNLPSPYNLKHWRLGQWERDQVGYYLWAWPFEFKVSFSNFFFLFMSKVVSLVLALYYKKKVKLARW